MRDIWSQPKAICSSEAWLAKLRLGQPTPISRTGGRVRLTNGSVKALHCGIVCSIAVERTNKITEVMAVFHYHSVEKLLHEKYFIIVAQR